MEDETVVKRFLDKFLICPECGNISMRKYKQQEYFTCELCVLVDKVKKLEGTGE